MDNPWGLDRRAWTMMDGSDRIDRFGGRISGSAHSWATLRRGFGRTGYDGEQNGAGSSIGWASSMDISPDSKTRLVGIADWWLPSSCPLACKGRALVERQRTERQGNMERRFFVLERLGAERLAADAKSNRRTGNHHYWHLEAMKMFWADETERLALGMVAPVLTAFSS